MRNLMGRVQTFVYSQAFPAGRPLIEQPRSPGFSVSMCCDSQRRMCNESTGVTPSGAQYLLVGRRRECGSCGSSVRSSLCWNPHRSTDDVYRSCMFGGCNVESSESHSHIVNDVTVRAGSPVLQLFRGAYPRTRCGDGPY